MQRTVVAIAAALVGWEGGPGLLVLDEPTAVLPPHDVASGCWRSSETSASAAPASCTCRTGWTRCSAIADRVTVLRGGRVVQTRPVKGLDDQALAELMVGTEVDAGYRAGLPVRAIDRPVVLRAPRPARPLPAGGRRRAARGRGARGGRPAWFRAGRAAVRDGGPLPGAVGESSSRASGWLPVRKSAAFDIPIVPADRGREAVISEFSVAREPHPVRARPVPPVRPAARGGRSASSWTSGWTRSRSRPAG